MLVEVCFLFPGLRSLNNKVVGERSLSYFLGQPMSSSSSGLKGARMAF